MNSSRRLTPAHHAQENALALMVGIVALATVLAYLPVMFNFFAGDDFVHLTWLKQAVVYPQLIWKNFYSSWLDGTTTKFYRPLISVFMVSDYMLWGLNGLGFHITNLLFHLTSTVVLFFVGLRLGKCFSGAPVETAEQSPVQTTQLSSHQAQPSSATRFQGSAMAFAFFASIILVFIPAPGSGFLDNRKSRHYCHHLHRRFTVVLYAVA